jgi:hypothetical protein
MARYNDLYRILLKKKGEAPNIKKGVPKISDLDEEVRSLRFTEEGLVEYVRYNNTLYKNVLQRENYNKLKSGFSFPYSGFSSSNSDTNYRSSQYAGGFAGLLGWAQSTASPTTIIPSSSRGFMYEADQDLEITNFNGFITRTAGNNDAYSFHLYKGTPNDGAGNFSTTLMGSSSSYSAASTSNLYEYSFKPSSSLLKKKERVYAFFKKDAHSGSASYYFAGTLQGKYI